MPRFKKIFLSLTILLVAIAMQMLRADDKTPASKRGPKMSAECKKYYNMAQKFRDDKRCIAYSDTMRALAIKNKDNFSVVVSYVEPCHYYDYVYDIPKMEESSKAMRQAALDGGYPQYFFRAYQIMIQAHLRRNAYSNAIQLIDEMRQEAYKLHNNYGIWLSHKMMADTYEQMDNQPMKRQSLLDAIAFWPNVYSESVTPLYVQLAETEQDATKRYNTMVKAQELANSRVDTIMLKNGWMNYYAFVNDKDNFNKLYEENILGKANPLGFSKPSKIIYDSYYKLYKGDKEGAIKNLSDHRNNLGNRYARYMARLYYSAEDYKELYRWHMIDDSIHKASQNNIIVRDLYAYNARMHNDSLRYAMSEKDAELKLAASEQERINAENARLNAEREREASERAKATAEAKQKDAELQLTKAVAERNKAQLKEAEQKRLQAEQARKLTQIEADNAQIQAENERNNTWVAVLAGAFVLLVAIVIMLIVYARKAARDLRHIELLNGKLRKAQQEAVDANKIKDLFLQNMTHEIRTPLNAISGFSQILTCPGIDISDNEKIEYGTHITNNVKILTMLLDDIINISDIETGNFTITKMSTNVKDLMTGAMSVTQYRVPAGVAFLLNNTLPDDFTINTDGNRAQQILVNFITNACKHTTQGSIEIKAEPGKGNDTVVFSVTDTGCGIPQDQAENIFERFTKLDAFKQGSGLGLYTCRIVSQKLDGRVWLDASYTNGARFCFEVPVKG